MKLYMAVSADQYELPIAVETSADGLADKLGLKKSTVLSSISKRVVYKKKGYVMIRIEVEDDLQI